MFNKYVIALMFLSTYKKLASINQHIAKIVNFFLDKINSVKE